MLERQLAEADRIEFNAGLGKGIRDAAFKRFRGRVAYVIWGIRQRKRTVSACPRTTAANLSHHAKLFVGVESGIRSDDVILKELSSELNVWLRQKLGTDRVLALKTAKMRKIISEGDDRAYEMFIRHAESLSGTESHRLIMSERLLRSVFLSRHLYAMLSKTVASHEEEIRSMAEKIRRMLRDRANGRVILTESILDLTKNLISAFDTLVSTIREGDESGFYGNAFEELCDIRRQLIWIGADVRNKFPVTR